MANKKTDLPTSSRHVLIYDEDWTFLDARFGQRTEIAYGVGPAVRDIVHKKVQEIRQRERDRLEEDGAGA